MSRAGLVLLLNVVGAGAASAQAISFLAPVDASTSGYARGTSMCQSCFAVADFSGDGKPDLVYSVAVHLPPAVVVLGNGDGTFRHGYEFSSSLAQGRPFTGDFNGDGKLDVAFSGGSVAIFSGGGRGKFGAPVTITACSSISAVADVNGHHRPDLICGNAVLLGQPDGSFRAVQSLPSPATLAADFNKDGKTDLLLMSGAAQLSVVLGNGDGSFGAAIPLTGAPVLQTILAGDFNGDGNIDLAGAFFDQAEIFVLPGRGDGTFASGILTEGLYGPLSAAADFNGDGNLDLVAGDAILAGNGKGTFRPPIFIGVVTPACGGAVPGSSVTPPCDFTRSGVVVADFNGDNLPDIAAGYVADGIQDTSVAAVSILLNDSPGDGFATAGVSSNSFLPVAPDSYVTAYGTNLASTAETAAGSPRPDTLGGIPLHVRDRSHATEVLAPLLYVSPFQINCVLPSDDPYAWVGIERIGTPYVAKAMAVPIGIPASVYDPALFSFGDGLAAASAVRVAPNGIQTPVTVKSCAATCSSTPIDLSGDPVYLTLYGTGFARATVATCYLANQAVAASYVGSPNSSGLDQVNLLLPKSLAGAGQAPVYCDIGNVYTNSVSVTIQ